MVQNSRKSGLLDIVMALLTRTPNSPDLNPLEYHVWGAMLEKFQKLNPKSQNVSDLKLALQVIWDSLPEGTICKSVVDFRKQVNAGTKADGKHFEHLLK